MPTFLVPPNQCLIANRSETHFDIIFCADQLLKNRTSEYRTRVMWLADLQYGYYVCFDKKGDTLKPVYNENVGN